MTGTKAEIRRAALQRRDGIDDETRAAFALRLAAVGPRLALDFAGTGNPPVTSAFSAIGSEPDPLPLMQALHAVDVPVMLPVDWSHGTSLVYRRWLPGDPLAAGPLGIGEPLPEAPETAPDVLFIPLVAFDRRGGRLGYGAGNVDITLRGLRSRKPVLVIGVAFGVQEEPDIPSESHDEPVDIIVTDHDILRCRP